MKVNAPSNIRPSILLFLLVFFASVQLASRTPPAYRELNGQIFKRVGKTELSADIFLPNAPGPKPAVIVVHGGGWSQRSGDMEWICKDLAQAGFVAVNITYRLAPNNLYPAAVDDVRDALKWLKSNASQFEVDPERIGGWGYSAGGNLLLLAGLDNQIGFKALVSGGTPADLTQWPNSVQVKTFLGQSLDANRALWEDASPIHHVQENSPPVFLYHGDWDWIVDIQQFNLMNQALKAKKVEHESYESPYLGHLAVYFLSQEAIDRGVGFLKRKL